MHNAANIKVMAIELKKKHFPCVVHILNLVKDVLSKLFEENLILLAIQKCEEFVSFFIEVQKPLACYDKPGKIILKMAKG